MTRPAPLRAASLSLLTTLLGALGAGLAATPATKSSPVAPAVTAQPATTQALTAQAPGAGLRGLWVDAFGPGLKTRAQVEKTVDDAVRLGINTLFVQAVRRADCLCRRSGYPVVTDADLERSFDPLSAVTALAHARGLKVIAWVSVTGASNTAAPNTNPAHVFRTHGPASAESWLARRADGSWAEGRDGWLDLGLPAAAEYVTQGILSLVRNYDIDGLQFDRIRYPDGGVWGYDPRVLARYRAETGQAGTPAADDPLWAEWKREQVTALVRRVSLEAKALKPDLWISAATITYLEAPRAGDLVSFRRTRTYWDVLQDWPTWTYTGLVDLNVLMNYKRDGVGDQALWFDGWNRFARSVALRRDAQTTALAAGSALYLNSPQVSAAQARRAREAGLGWVGYSYRTPTEGVYGQRESTAQGLDAIRALLGVPFAPWTETPPTVRGLVGRVVGPSVPGGRAVEVYQGGQKVAETPTDGAGYYGFAALAPGPAEVRVLGQRWVDTVPDGGVVRLPDLLVHGGVRPVGVPAVPPPPARPPAPPPGR